MGQSQATMHEHDLENYRKRLESFGWNTQVVDGHDVAALVAALDKTSQVKGQPSCILAKTFKGKSFLDIENSPAWHGKPLGNKTEAVINSLRELIKDTSNKLAFELLPIKAPTNNLTANNISNIQLSKPPSYKLGEEVSI